MNVPRVEVYERKDGGFDWRLIGLNGEQLGESSQGYTERNDAHEGWHRVVSLIVEACGTGMHVSYLGIEVVDVDRNGQPIS